MDEIKNAVNLRKNLFFPKTRLLEHVQLCEKIPCCRCQFVQLNTETGNRKGNTETVRYVLNVFYSKTRLSQSLNSYMELLKKCFLQNYI